MLFVNDDPRPRESHQMSLSKFIFWYFYWSESCLNPDIFVPEFGLGGDEVLHQGDAGGVLHHVDSHATGSEQFFVTHKGLVFTNDHVGDAIEQDGAGAHGAWRQGGVEDGFFVHAGG